MISTFDKKKTRAIGNILSFKSCYLKKNEAYGIVDLIRDMGREYYALQEKLDDIENVISKGCETHHSHAIKSILKGDCDETSD